METNPNTGPNPNFQPAPQVGSSEQAPTGAPEQAPAPPTPEKKGPAGESANQNAGATLPPPVLQPTPVPQPVQKTDAPTADATVAAGPPLASDDVDVIEKEWVDKAKTIVNKTSNDPYKQNKEVSELKADYMKKRYNKDIKLQGDSKGS